MKWSFDDNAIGMIDDGPVLKSRLFERPVSCKHQDWYERAPEICRVLNASMTEGSKHPRCVLQDWVLEIPMMQQTVLLTATRGPDGLTKYHPLKYLLRWYRRCFLKSSLDGLVLDNPWDRRGGSFTGPSVLIAEGLYESTGTLPPRMALDEDGAWEEMGKLVDKYIAGLDEIPHHFAMHFMHGVEILGYKHEGLASSFWFQVYERLVNDMHLHPETKEELDRRLGDSYEGWMERNDVATMT